MLVATLALLLALTPRMVAAATPQVAFSPSMSTVAPGDLAQVDVTVAGVDAASALGGYTVDIAFDPAVVRLDSIVDSGFITTGTAVVLCGTATIDNLGGHSHSVCAPIPLPGSTGVSNVAPKALMHASFTAQATGTSALDLSGTTLSGVSGTAIAASLSNGSIQVSGGGGAQPATALPTSPAATSTRQPPEPTPALAPSITDGASTSTPAPTARFAPPTGTAGGLRVPNTGDAGGGRARSPLLVAVAGLVVVLVLAGVGGLALRRRLGS